MAFAGILRNVFRQRIAGINCSQLITRAVLPASCTAFSQKGLPIASCIQTRGYRKKIDVSHLKPLNYDHAEDLVAQEELDPKDILFKYKGIEGIDSVPENVRKLFTVEYASAKEKLEHRNMVLQDKITQIVGPGLRLEKQVAYLTVKIRNMVPYIINNRQNKMQKSYLEERIAKRKKLLGYLRQLDYERYMWILKELKVTYTPYDKFAYLKLSRKARMTKEVREKMWAERKDKIEVVRARFQEEKEKFMKHKQQVLKEIDEYIEKQDLDKASVIEQYQKHIATKTKEMLEASQRPRGSKKINEYIKLKKIRKEKESRVV